MDTSISTPIFGAIASQSKWRERAPKRVKMPNGSDAVVIDGGKPNTIGITRSVRVARMRS